MCFGNESSATSALPDGRWLCAVPQRRDALDTHCIYAPFNCRYGYWDRDSLVPMFDAFLQANGRPMWIFIGGDSRSRGIWLSLIDLLIDHRNLTSSRAWKCWGVSEFRTPSLRLTWHDMREQHKDPYREHGDHPELPRVKADFDAALSHDGRRPDVLVIQFGFDVLPADLAAAEGPPSTKRIMLSGWDYWKESQHLTHVSTPIDGWMYFDTQRLTLPMLDHMCDESDYRKHFHTNCGEYLCGFVNRMQSQMLFTTMFGPPPAPTHSDTQHLTHAPRLPPVRTFEMCTRCKTEFNTKYALDLPPFECQSNHLDSVMEINDRQFCVTRRLVLDGHAVKVKNRLAEHFVLAQDSQFFLPGAHYVSLEHPIDDEDDEDGSDDDSDDMVAKVAPPPPPTRPPQQPTPLDVNNDNDEDPKVVIARLLALVEDSTAEVASLKARLHDEAEKHKVEVARWLGLFNAQADRQHHETTAEMQTSARRQHHSRAIEAPAVAERAEPSFAFTTRLTIAAIVLVALVVIVRLI